MNRRALLERIRRCLALARSANEHEAAAALAKARELMDLHEVDQDELAALEIEETTARRHRSDRAPRWEHYLVAAVIRAIPCRQLIDGPDRRFIGVTPAPEIAAYAFAALLRQLRRARADYMARALRRVRTAARKTTRADAFCEGWASAVLSTIAKLYPPPPERADVAAYLERRFGQLELQQPRAANGQKTDNDRWRGYDQGRQVDLHHGLVANPAPRALTNI